MKLNNCEIPVPPLFSTLQIDLVKHDDSPCGLPCYIEVTLGYMPKNKGALVLDLGNYIYRTTGIAYEMVPEFRGQGSKTTVRWFVSWKGIEPYLSQIQDMFDGPKVARYLPFEFRRVTLQKGVKI